MANNSHQSDNLAPAYHRCLGTRLYLTDLDALGTKSDDIYTVWLGLNMQDTYKSTYIIDFKRINSNTDQTIEERFAMKAQMALADREKIPFFVVLTYLNDNITSTAREYTEPMYYVIPNNIFSKNYFNFCKLPLSGKWMTVRRFSKFLHAVKGIKWNPNDPIPIRDRWNIDLKLSDANLFTLKDLPNKHIEYCLPTINLTGQYK